MAKTKTAADNLCERLIEWGTTTIYGFPGDGINGILGSLRRHQDQLRFIQTRHEEMASFHGVRARQVHRPGRGVHGHVGAGRHPPAERTV